MRKDPTQAMAVGTTDVTLSMDVSYERGYKTIGLRVLLLPRIFHFWWWIRINSVV